MKQETKELAAAILQYIFDSEETHYEETVEEHGLDSEQATNHIYNLARTLWAELGIDH